MFILSNAFFRCIAFSIFTLNFLHIHFFIKSYKRHKFSQAFNKRQLDSIGINVFDKKKET